MKAEVHKKDYPSDLLDLAKKVIWFERPETALANTEKFLCAVMTNGRIEDLLTAQKYYTDDEFTAALKSSYSKNMDKRSYNYWRLILDRD